MQQLRRGNRSAKWKWRPEDVQDSRHPHLRDIAALERAGFQVVRQGKHVIMSNGTRTLVVPCANPIHAVTMGIIVRDAGLTVEEFKGLL